MAEAQSSSPESASECENNFVPKLLVVLGAEGSQRTAQTEFLSLECNYHRINVGEMLMEVRLDPESDYHALLKPMFERGIAVPPDVVCALVILMIRKTKCHNYVIEDFPTNLEELKYFEQLISPCVDLKHVFYMKAPTQHCLEQYLGSDPDNIPGGQQLMQETEKMINEYFIKLAPVIDYYKKRSLVRELDSTKSYLVNTKIIKLQIDDAAILSTLKDRAMARQINKVFDLHKATDDE